MDLRIQILQLTLEWVGKPGISGAKDYTGLLMIMNDDNDDAPLFTNVMFTNVMNNLGNINELVVVVGEGGSN